MSLERPTPTPIRLQIQQLLDGRRKLRDELAVIKARAEAHEELNAIAWVDWERAAAQADAAVAEDRRRLAREMHDGVLQELGYIRSELAAFTAVDEARVNRILGASERALDEARQMLTALGRTDDEPLADALERALEQIAERYGVVLALELDALIPADSAQRHALVRIAREAALNAVRHGRAERINVVLGEDGDGRFLRVVDDGRGFEPGNRTAGQQGFGLIGMRERAEALPGRIEIDSSPAGGTRVEVRW